MHYASPNPTLVLKTSRLTADTLALTEFRQGGLGNKGSCLLTELVRRQMKHEMSMSCTTQTYQILYGEGMEGKRGSNLCHAVKTLTNIQIKRINFMGHDSKQNVEADCVTQFMCAGVCTNLSVPNKIHLFAFLSRLKYED